jgi:hypothetical protein
MGKAELKAIFKLINSPENKKILDDNKNDIQRAVFSLKQGFGKGTMDFLKGLNPSALSRVLSDNPDLKKIWESAGKTSGTAFSEGLGKKVEETTKKFSWFKLLLGIGTSTFNPWIGSRLLSDTLAKSGGGAGGSISRGIFGAGGAIGFTEFYIAINALKNAISKLKEVVQGAIEKGYSIYTGAAQQGLNTRYFAQRSALADILGVSGNPNQVFKFGAATAYISDKISNSISEISKNARPLAELEMNAKIMRVDFNALASNIAVKFVPALNKFIDGLDTLIKFLDSPHPFLSKFEKVFGERGIRVVTGLSLLSKWAEFWQRIGWWSGGSSMADFSKNQSRIFDSKGIADAIPRLQRYMNQLPASSWERMGLVIGGSFQERALEFQRRTAIAVEKIYQYIAQQNRKPQQYYMNRNPFVTQY